MKRFFSTLLMLFFLLPACIQANPPILQDIEQGDFSFDSLKGKWVFINYWASWCAPCLHEIPEFNRFYTENKTKNVAVFGVNYDGLNPEEQLPLIKTFQLTYPSLSIDPADALKLGDIKGVPVTFVFNPEGKLVAVNYGEQTEQSLKAYIL